MQSTEEPSTVCLREVSLRRRADRWSVQGAFFGGVWAYVWVAVNPRLLYDAFGIYLPYPEFSLDEACFQQAWSRAGGPRTRG
jgi:hypothetical protein